MIIFCCVHCGFTRPKEKKDESSIFVRCPRCCADMRPINVRDRERDKEQKKEASKS